jgi:hypothetical protein
VNSYVKEEKENRGTVFLITGPPFYATIFLCTVHHSLFSGSPKKKMKGTPAAKDESASLPTGVTVNASPRTIVSTSRAADATSRTAVATPPSAKRARATTAPLSVVGSRRL